MGLKAMLTQRSFTGTLVLPPVGKDERERNGAITAKVKTSEPEVSDLSGNYVRPMHFDLHVHAHGIVQIIMSHVTGIIAI